MASTPAIAPMIAASATTMAWTWPTVMPWDRRIAISRTRSLMPIAERVHDARVRR